MFLRILFIFVSVCLFCVSADDVTQIKPEIKDAGTPQITDKQVTTDHTVTIGGKVLGYKATTGTLVLKDQLDKSKATIFYIAYTKKDEGNHSKRPITFCFNGGPGSSSVWLHMGVFGPRRVAFDDKGYALPPYQMTENEYSILDLTDLVFIDPVSTGYSRAAFGEDEKQFHGVEEDIKAMADFIRLFVTKEERWDSPKYIAGESYGTTRAAGLANNLHDDKYLYVNGIILLSSVLNFQTLHDPHNGNDLPYILYLPTYTAAAFYHKKLTPELQKDFKKTLEEAQQFANTDYTLALMQGNKIDSKRRQEIVQKLALYSGISPEFIERSNMRISPFAFAKELLRKENRTIGRFDACYTGIDVNGNSQCFEYDPSAEAIFGAFTAVFNQYVRSDLKWVDDQEYKIITSLQNWRHKGNQYTNVSGDLREVMTKNPAIKVFVASGYYDLATPYFATEHTINHLGLDPSLQGHITMKNYAGGHMMYVQRANLIQMKKDLSEFFKEKP